MSIVLDDRPEIQYTKRPRHWHPIAIRIHDPQSDRPTHEQLFMYGVYRRKWEAVAQVKGEIEKDEGYGGAVPCYSKVCRARLTPRKSIWDRMNRNIKAERGGRHGI